MTKYLLVIATLSIPAAAETLGAYLALTDSQIAEIGVNNAAYNRMSLQKQERLLQVEKEIVEETTASPLNPANLGLRYAEIETICRELATETRKLYEKNKALLNDQQKARLKTLEDALVLLPLAYEAQGTGVAASSGVSTSVFYSTFDRPGGAPIAGTLYAATPGMAPVPGCRLGPLGISAREARP